MSALLGAAAFLIYPVISRSLRVSEYKKLLHDRRGEPNPVLFSKLEGFVEKADWKEARLLADLLCPILREDAEPLLYCAAAYLETGDIEGARSAARRAKAVFREEPTMRARIETRNKPLFWKVGFLLREPGV